MLGGVTVDRDSYLERRVSAMGLKLAVALREVTHFPSLSVNMMVC